MDLETYKFKVQILKNMINSLDEYNKSFDNSNEVVKVNSIIIDEFKNLIKKLENNLENHKEKMDKKIEDKLTPEEKDTLEYKKNYSLLNKSFWEAREKVASEKIKFPSSLYEQRVKEYQNKFLIDNFNISLEEIEYNIDNYKEKYASNIYMDSVYDRALSNIKNTNTYSIEEICDETNGISLLYRHVYNILSDDLNDIIYRLTISDAIDDSEFKEVSEYKKEINTKKLLNKKSMIENQMSIIENKAKLLGDEL